MTAQILYKRNGQYLRVKGVTSNSDGTPVNNATVTAKLSADPYFASREQALEVIPEVNGLVLPYVDGSSGDYQAVIAASFNPAASNYILQIDITCPGLQPAHAEVKVTCQGRSL